MARIKRNIFIEINAQFGSDFQKSSAQTTLEMLLKSWATFYKGSNKKNIISYEINKADE